MTIPLRSAVIVDDSPAQGTQLAQIMTRRGIKVLAICESGPAGLAAIRTHKPTIATIDNQMPGMDGLSVVRALAAENSKTILVMCSGTAQKAVMDAAYAAGAADFIVKPYDNAITGRTLDAILARAKPRT